MDLLAIRKWQVEQAFMVDTKWSETMRQSSERIFLAAAAFLIGAPAYLEKVGIARSGDRYDAMLLLIGVAMICSGLLFFFASDAQTVATRRTSQHLLKLGQDDELVLASTAGTSQIWRARVPVMFAVWALCVAFGLAGSMVLRP